MRNSCMALAALGYAIDADSSGLACGEAGEGHLFRASHWIDNLNSGEILFVVSHHHAIVCAGYSGDDHIECAARSTGALSFRHEACPDQSCLVIVVKNSTCKQCLRPLRSGEPGVERITLPAVRLFQNSATDFGNRQGGDEQLPVLPRRHPGQQQFRRLQPDDIADYVGVEKIACHSSTLRPSSRGRVRSKSAPTSGERRRAFKMPPGFGGSSATAVFTAARTSSASGPSSARRRASVRIRSR